MSIATRGEAVGSLLQRSFWDCRTRIHEHASQTAPVRTGAGENAGCPGLWPIREALSEWGMVPEEDSNHLHNSLAPHGFLKE